MNKKDISNKQRMAIELTALLLVGGAVLWAKAAPGQQAAPDQQPANLIRTHRIEVVDKAGATRMYMGLDAANNPAIALYNARHVQRLTLQLSGGSKGSPETATIRLANSDGYPLLFAQANDNITAITLNKMGPTKSVNGVGNTGGVSATGRSVVKTITILPTQNIARGENPIPDVDPNQ